MNIELVMKRRKEIAKRERSRLRKYDLRPIEELSEHERVMLTRIWLRGEKSNPLVRPTVS